MKLLELINRLNDLKKRYGDDLPVEGDYGYPVSAAYLPEFTSEEGIYCPPSIQITDEPVAAHHQEKNKMKKTKIPTIIKSEIVNGFSITIDRIDTQRDPFWIHLEITDHTVEARDSFAFSMSVDDFDRAFQHLLDKTHEYILEEKEKKKTLREKVEDLLKQVDKEYLHYISKDKLRGILNSTEKDE